MAFKIPEEYKEFSRPSEKRVPVASEIPFNGEGYSPTGKQIALGLGVDVAGGMASQAIGAFTGPGYFLIAPVGGFFSNLAAQKVEGREDVSIGRALVAGLANLIPGPVGKLGRGIKGVGSLAKGEALKGAGIGAADATAHAVIDEGRLPTGGELAFGGAIGGTFGGAVGGVAGGVRKFAAHKRLPKILEDVTTGKTTPEEVDRLLAASPEYAPKLKKAIQQTAEREGLPDPFDPRDGVSFEAMVDESVMGHNSREAAKGLYRLSEAVSDAPLSKGSPMDRVKQAVDKVNLMARPSRFLSREVMHVIKESSDAKMGAQLMGGVKFAKIKTFLEREPSKVDEKWDNLKRFLREDPDNPPDIDLLKPVIGELDTYRNGLREYQKALVKELRDIKDDPLIAEFGKGNEMLKDLTAQIEQIEDSMKPGGKRWVNQSFQMFTNKKWNPGEELRQAAFKERLQEVQLEKMMAKDGKPLTDKEKTDAVNEVWNQFTRWDETSARRKAEKGGMPDKSRDKYEAVVTEFQKDWSTSPKQAEYLGLIDDPAEELYNTFTKAARLKAAIHADRELARILSEDEAIGGAAFGGGKVYSNVSKKDMGILPKDYEELATQFKGSVGGVFVHKDVNKALKAFYYNNDKLFAQHPATARMYDAWAALTAGSKIAKTLLNPASYAINFTGGLSSSVASGIFPTMRFGKSAAQGFKLSLKQSRRLDRWLSGKVSPEEKVAEYQDMARAADLGVLSGTLASSDIRDTLNRGPLNDLLEKVASPASKLYNVADQGLRYANWKAVQDQLGKVWRGASRSELEVAAARLVNDTFQNYDMLGNFPKILSRVGLLNPFVAFSAELMRNTYHQMRYAKQMVMKEFGKDIGLDPSKADMEAMRNLGMQRAAGMMAVLGGAAGGIYALNEVRSGLSEKQQDQFGETVAATWDQGKRLGIVLNKDGKTGKYFDPEYLAPQTLLLSAAQSAWRGEPIEDLWRIFANNFLGQGSFPLENLGALTTGKDRNGRDISFAEDEIKQRKDQMLHYIKEVFEPGAFREIEKWNRMIEGQEGALDAAGLVGRLVGFRYNEFNIYDNGVMRIKDKVGNLNNIRSKLAYARRRGLNAEFQQTYQQLEESRKVTMGAIRKHYQNLMGLGLAEDEAAQALKDSGLSTSDQFDIMTGGYTPMPKTARVSQREIYESLGDTPEARYKKIMASRSELDRKQLRDLLRLNRNDRRTERKNLSPMETVLKRMDAAQRTERMIQLGLTKGDPRTSEWYNKGLLTKDMIRALPN